ncbi:hypothetical protein [Peribacillus sp. NPDC096540]|uniref:hypothetical protein n=1 Tax=Peribacillus sp. NPDC096540 TaxID=3390612 RepID=UPI003D006081
MILIIDHLETFYVCCPFQDDVNLIKLYFKATAALVVYQANASIKRISHHI